MMRRLLIVVEIGLGDLVDGTTYDMQQRSRERFSRRRLGTPQRADSTMPSCLLSDPVAPIPPMLHGVPTDDAFPVDIRSALTGAAGAGTYL